MNRRGFLRFLAATPVMPLVAKIPVAVVKPVELDLVAFNYALKEIYTQQRVESLLNRTNPWADLAAGAAAGAEWFLAE